MTNNDSKYNWKKIAGFIGLLAAIVAATIVLTVIQSKKQADKDFKRTTEESFKMGTADLSTLEKGMEEKIKQPEKKKKDFKRNASEKIKREEEAGDPGQGDKFIAYPNGIIYDIENDLEWFPGPDVDIYLVKAREWVKNLKLDGGGWRLPTRCELKGLYKKGAGKRNMTPVFKTTGWCLWSGEGKNRTSDSPSYTWCFNFKDGSESYEAELLNDNKRVFAVRPREPME